MAYISTAERRKIPNQDMGEPPLGFPADTEARFRAAVHLIGKAKNPAAVKARLIRIARRHGWSLPESWETGKDTDKDADD